MKVKTRKVNFSFLQKFNMIYFLFSLLIIASFLLGVLITKVQYLENGVGANAIVAAQPSGGETIDPGLGPENTGPQTASIDDDPIMGSADAPITMIEFSDFECPFCKSFYDETLPEIKSNYIDTGKVKFVYRDLPLSFHDPLATLEAVAANCAREQGNDETYFQYHDEIFNRTESNGNGLSNEDLSTIASDIGLDVGSFETCLNSDKYSEEIQKDIADAASIGGTGTPTFLIGKTTSDGVITGQVVVGAQPLQVFTAILDELGSE